MANQLLDVATNDIITSTRSNLINDMIDDGSVEINTLFLEIGGTTTIDSVRSFTGNTLTLIQTTTSGAGISLSRNLSSDNTNSPLITIINSNALDDQPLATFTQSGQGGGISITCSASSLSPMFTLANSSIQNDFTAINWEITSGGVANFKGLDIDDVTIVDVNKNIFGNSLSIASGLSTISSAGLGTFQGIVSGLFSVDSSGNLVINSGNASINTDGDANFTTLSINGNVVYQEDGFFAPPVAVDPASPIDGQIWLNTTDRALKIWIDGAARIIVQV